VGRLRCAEVRYGRPGSADGTSCAAAESARSLAPTLRAFSSALRRPTRGPFRSRARPHPPSAPSPASGRRKRSPFSHLREKVLGGRMRAIGVNPSQASLLLFGAPLGAARARRKKPAGWPAGCRPVRCQARDGLSANLRSVLAQSAFGRPRPRGCPSLWLLSLGQARESDPRAGMRVETHRDVRRVSREGRRSNWIPAFAGMTECGTSPA
jgi:hypothetical protein